MMSATTALTSPLLCDRSGDDGEIYTGLADGRVVRLDPNGENPQTVFFTGGVVSEAGRAVGSTTGVDFGNRLLHVCHEKVTTLIASLHAY